MRPAMSLARWLLAVCAETPARAASSPAGRASPPARARHMAAREGSARRLATKAMSGSLMPASLARGAPRCFTTRRTQMCGARVADHGGPHVNDNGYRVRAERGEVQSGTWVTMVRTPAVLTLLQAAGLDFARVDMEHSPFSMETVADMATLARALDFPLVVRPPAGNREWITRLLDAGVWNLHVPQVDTPEQAAAVAACARYAPLGERGMYGFGPHTMYRTLPAGEHMAAANARVHVTAMLETKGAFDRLDEIASVPGIDALTIGPTDLAQDLGVLGTPAQRDTLAQYRRRLVDAARRHGKAVAMLTDSLEGIREMIALGASIINYSSDAAVLRSSYAAITDEVRRGRSKGG